MQPIRISMVNQTDQSAAKPISISQISSGNNNITTNNNNAMNGSNQNSGSKNLKAPQPLPKSPLKTNYVITSSGNNDSGKTITPIKMQPLTTQSPQNQSQNNNGISNQNRVHTNNSANSNNSGTTNRAVPILKGSTVIQHAHTISSGVSNNGQMLNFNQAIPIHHAPIQQISYSNLNLPTCTAAATRIHTSSDNDNSNNNLSILPEKQNSIQSINLNTQRSQQSNASISHSMSNSNSTPINDEITFRKWTNKF